jgi:DNA polymerase/3'-5' exonuclease PolX
MFHLKEFHVTESKMSEGVKIPLAKAKATADRFLLYIAPHCKICSIAGSVRRECATVGDIEVVAVPKDEFSLNILFPEGYKGLVVNGSRLKRFKYPELNLQIELYITTREDYGRILAIRTGSSAFSHIKLAVRWGRLGWAGTENGLRRKSECNHKSVWKIKPEYKSCPTLPPPFYTENDFFNFLSIPWVHPRERSWLSKYSEINYSK